MSRKGFNECARCGVEYIYGINEGGTKYCGACRYPARLETNRKNRLLKPSVSDGRETRREREVEYIYPWACGVCGMKKITEAGAVRCCVNAGSLSGKPIELEGGFWWNNGILKDIQLGTRLLMRQVPITALASRTQTSNTLAAPTVETPALMMNSGPSLTSLPRPITSQSSKDMSAGIWPVPNTPSGSALTEDIDLVEYGSD